MKEKQKKKKEKQKCWPEDFVGQPKTLEQHIDRKLSEWHDDDYEAGYNGQGKDW
jgi:hypothetical protein